MNNDDLTYNGPSEEEQALYPECDSNIRTTIKPDESKPAVSKTLAMKCAQCPKACFLHINMRGLEADITSSTQNKFDVGTRGWRFSKTIIPWWSRG